MATEINLKGHRIPTISTHSKISKADQKLFSTKTKREILDHILATQGASISALTYIQPELSIGVPNDDGYLVDFYLQIGTKQSPLSATIDDSVIRVSEKGQVIFQIAVDAVESIRYGQSNSIEFKDDEDENDDFKIEIDDKLFEEFMQLVEKHEKQREEKAKVEAEKEIVVDFRKKTTTKTQSKKKK